MNFHEQAITFDCEGSALVGVIHIPESVRTRGLILAIAGGPQYRGGVGRLHVQMARELAAMGVPVMRFDYRGMGDSEGQFRDFIDVEADLASAIAAFRAHVSQVREVVLFGGCSAASSIMINAWKYPEVTGIAVSNPWVHTAETGDESLIKHHFSRRARDLDFWLKVIRLQYNPLPALGAIARSMVSRVKRKFSAAGAGPDAQAADNPSQPFIPRMRQGLSRFRGDMLLVMAGRSLVGKEFDDLVESSTAWQQAMRSPRQFARHDMADADQTNSSIASRAELIALTGQWMLDTRGLPQTAGSTHALQVPAAA